MKHHAQTKLRDTNFAEAAIIANLACFPANLRKLNIIADDFKNNLSRNIFTAITSRVNSDSDFNLSNGSLTSLAAMLDPDSLDYLRTIVSDQLIDAVVKIEVLEKELRKIQAENLVSEIVARENITDPALIASLIQEKLKELSAMSLKSGKALGLEVFRDIERLQELKGALSGITSSVTGLDAYTHGFQNGLFYIIAGRTSMGKSAVLANLFLAALKENKNPVFVTLEESDKSVAMRLASILSGVSSEKARSGTLTSEEWDATTLAATKLSELEPLIMPAHGMTAEKISAKVHALNNQRKIGMVICDHLHEIKHAESSKFESEPTKISNSLQVLRSLCVQLDVPLLLAAQINREVEGRENKRPGMGNLKGSGSIEQVADMIWILFRQSYYDAARPERDTIEINIAKNRNGRTGTVQVGFEPASLKILDWDSSCYLGESPEASMPKFKKGFNPYGYGGERE